MYQLWIDGRWVDAAGGRKRLVEDPATLETVDMVAEAGQEDVERAVASAVAAQERWRRVPAVERATLLHEIAAALRADRAGLSELLTREGGKPRIENVDEVEW